MQYLGEESLSRYVRSEVFFLPFRESRAFAGPIRNPQIFEQSALTGQLFWTRQNRLVRIEHDPVGSGRRRQTE